MPLYCNLKDLYLMDMPQSPSRVREIY